MKEETITTRWRCDRCGHLSIDGKDIREEAIRGAGRSGHLDIHWSGNRSHKDDYDRWVDREDSGAAWLCQECRKDFFRFMGEKK